MVRLDPADVSGGLLTLKGAHDDVAARFAGRVVPTWPSCFGSQAQRTGGGDVGLSLHAQLISSAGVVVRDSVD